MTEATLLALGSAVLHASWNLLVKTSDDRFLAAWGQFLVGGLLAGPGCCPSSACPGSRRFRTSSRRASCTSATSARWSVRTTTATSRWRTRSHAAAARWLAAIGGVAFLGDSLSGLEWLAIAVVVGGLASLVRPSASRVSPPVGGLTAVTIGTYTTLDIEGARRSSGFGYGVCLMLGAASARERRGGRVGRGPVFVALAAHELAANALGGLCATTAYSMVLAAEPPRPAGRIRRALRESSVVIAAAAGWLLLHERLGRARLVSAAVVAAGLALLVVWS